MAPIEVTRRQTALPGLTTNLPIINFILLSSQMTSGNVSRCYVCIDELYQPHHLRLFIFAHPNQSRI